MSRLIIIIACALVACNSTVNVNVEMFNNKHDTVKVTYVDTFYVNETPKGEKAMVDKKVDIPSAIATGLAIMVIMSAVVIFANLTTALNTKRNKNTWN